MKTTLKRTFLKLALACRLTLTATALFAQQAAQGQIAKVAPLSLVRIQNNSIPSGKTPSPLAGPTGGALGLSQPLGGLQVGQSFEGIDFNGSACNCLPPDTGAAVGNNYVVETVNLQVRVFDKATGSVLLDESLESFFGEPVCSDPYVMYDEMANRWYVSVMDGPCSGLLLAVSNDGNPLDGFLPPYHLADVGGLPDFPKPGFNQDAIFISYNDFGGAGGDAAIASIDKAAALSGTLTYHVSHPQSQFRAMPPAQMHGDTTGGVEWFVSTDGSTFNGPLNTIRVTKMENYLSASPTFTYTSLPVATYANAGMADQPGGSGSVFVNDATTTQVQYHNGHLVTSMEASTASDGFNYSKGLYYQVDVSSGTPTLLREGVIDPGPGVAVLMPSVDEDTGGHLGLTWMEVSSSENLSMWVGTIDTSGNLGSFVAAPGGGFFTYSFRIGDYSTTVLDPTDGKTFWSANEYIGTDGDTDIWRTFIASFTAGMSVATTTPANGEVLSAPPTGFVVGFSDAYDSVSINLAGVTVNGLPPNSFTVVDDHTISFTYAPSPVSSQGLQVFAVAAGTVRRLSDGDPVQPHNSTFRYDALQMQVVSTVPADGSATTFPLTSLVVNLNEVYDPASVATSDLILSAGKVESFQLINPQSIQFLLSGITYQRTLSFSLAAGALTDAFGNPSLPYAASVSLDYGTPPFTIAQTFEGIDFNGSSCGCLPPDTGAAVGNNFVMETVNVQLRVFDKTSGSILLDESLESFFGALSGGDVYVVYDDIADRWYVSAFDSDDTGLFLAVSVDGNPLHGFLPKYHLTNVGGFPDFHKPGFNKDAIFISYNDFGPSGNGSAAIATIDKAQALAGHLVYYVTQPDFQFRAMPPAQMHGDTTGGVEWFVSTDGSTFGGPLSTIRVTKMVNYLSISPTFTYTTLPVAPYSNGQLADQPGGGGSVFVNDATTTQVQYHNGHLVTAMEASTASDGFNSSKGVYYQVNVSGGTPTLLQQGAIDPGIGVSVLMPSVDEDSGGNLGLTWMEVSSLEFLSMWVGTVDHSGTIASLVAAPGGGFFYQSFRIGDYSTTVLDPTDGKTFWSANEYIGNDGDTDIWRTHITSFYQGTTPPPPPLLGDLNGDGCVDKTDLNLLVAAIKAKSKGPKYDLNGDGKVDAADTRWLALHFTNPGGAPCH